MGNFGVACIAIPVDLTQSATPAGIETTGRHIYVLGFDLELPASFLSGPIGCMPKKRCTDSYPPHLGMNTDVP